MVQITGIVGSSRSSTTWGEDGPADDIERLGDENEDIVRPKFGSWGEVGDPVDDASLLDRGALPGVAFGFVGEFAGMKRGEVGGGGVIEPEDRRLLNI